MYILTWFMRLFFFILLGIALGERRFLFSLSLIIFVFFRYRYDRQTWSCSRGGGVFFPSFSLSNN